jgi:Ca2+/Na+ antiporter
MRLRSRACVCACTRMYVYMRALICPFVHSCMRVCVSAKFQFGIWNGDLSPKLCICVSYLYLIYLHGHADRTREQQVKSYKYLGVVFFASGPFKGSVVELGKKALKSIFALKRKIHFKGISHVIPLHAYKLNRLRC